ncbi:MAG TPA: DVU0150 family protein [Bryobacteraceae bacterium]|nr:DVU0150 family protein [Bryobacteraceae bacterium]
MRKSWFNGTRTAALLLAASAVARGSQNMVLVADSRRCSGWEAWWSGLYNDSLFWFAILTIVILPAMGLAMAQATELLMKRIGINLKARTPMEH